MAKGRDERRPSWRGTGAAVLLLVALAAPGAARAQDATTRREAPQGADKADSASGGGAGAAAGQGGVGGTGLGKIPPAGGAAGTGNSVKGPPGQGITAPIDPMK